MAKVGETAHGTVIRVLNYGALVRLDDECLGLVHISEIDSSYVRDVRDYVCEGARVAVKVINEKEGGRLEFSIKRVDPSEQQNTSVPVATRPEFPLERPSRSEADPEFEADETDAEEEEYDDAPYYDSRVGGGSNRMVFDAKLREFLMDSSERLGDLKKHQESKLGHKRR